ncbi:MAG: undecaprenyl-diphosphate phosphatase [Gammaproteobacteria bacterium]
MEPLQVLVLAVLQGLTEFLPISSSAHLILVPLLTHWRDQGIAFDVAVHVGTLAAVVAYFRKDLKAIVADCLRSLRLGRAHGNSRLAWLIVIGTIPAGFGGFALNLIGDAALRSPVVIAVATIGFGLALWWADATARNSRPQGALVVRDAVLIGLAQALALIPGTSRSGITITAGLALGLTRDAAARFSFLLSIPLIASAGLLKAKEAFELGDPGVWSSLVAGAIISGVVAYLTIHFFLKLLERIGLMPFVVYRLILGVVLLALFWG